MRIHLAMVLGTACASVPPEISVEIGPDGADTRDDLVATLQGANSAAFHWFVDDQEVGELEGLRVPASFTARGQVWRAEASVTVDGDSNYATDSVLIANAVPTVQLSLAPNEPESSDALIVAALARDADGDDLTVVYSWFKDGQPQTDLTGDRVDADRIRRGETWRIEVAASDGMDPSKIASAEVSVLNGAPVVLDGGVEPENPRANHAVVAWANIEDPDGDATVVRWDWFIGERRVQSGPSARLEPGHHRKGDTIRAEVVATDGLGKTSATVVGTAIVRNSPPLAPSVRISPTEPVAGEALRCEPLATPADADGDPVTGWQFVWTANGKTTTSTTSNYPGDTINAARTEGEDVWLCAARATDGEDWSGWGSHSVEVEEAGFSPSMTVAGRTVSCTSITNTSSVTTCEGLTVDGKAFPNGLSCGLGWSAAASPWTDHADFCSLITGSRAFQADYQCSVTQSRVTWVAGAWGSREDNGYTRSLSCYW